MHIESRSQIISTFIRATPEYVKSQLLSSEWPGIIPSAPVYRLAACHNGWHQTSVSAGQALLDPTAWELCHICQVRLCITDTVNMFIGVRNLCRKDFSNLLTYISCCPDGWWTALWLGLFTCKHWVDPICDTLLTLMAARGSSWWETVLSLFRVSHGHLEAPLA